MTCKGFWTGIFVTFPLLGSSGCSPPASRADLQRLEARLQAQEQKQATLQDRFVLHEVRSGPLITTGLLDKQTGRVWLLAAEKGRSDTVGGFEPMRINTFAPTPSVKKYLGPFAPPTAQTLEVELPSGWTAKEIQAEAPPCPSNDPLGLFASTPCAPLPPKKGDR
jgi:hypothetical protein